MKSLLPLFALALLITSCDDGDLTFENIDFDDVATRRCENTLYKINENEALIVNIGDTEDQFDNFFSENPTGGAIPTLVNINSAVAGGLDILVNYRLFDGEVGEESICAAIPPINPTAIEDWTATRGFMQITTTAVTTPNTTTGFAGGQKITGYRHNIIFTDIEFNRSSGSTQLYPTFNFGSFDKPITNPLPVTFDQQLEKCDAAPVVFNIAGLHAIALVIDPALINGATLDVPQLATIDGTANAFSYLIYEDGTLSGPTHFCTATPANNPIQIWTGTGQVEVTSTQVGSSLQHTIVLKDVILRRGNNEFILATNYNMGVLLTE